MYNKIKVWDMGWDLGYEMGYGIWDLGWDMGLGWAYGIGNGWEWDFREWDMGGKYSCVYL